MNDIRLLVLHPDEATAAAIAARLRDATVEPSKPQSHPPENYNAVAFFGIAKIDLSYLASRTHVLLVAPPCPSLAAIERLTEWARKSEVRLVVVNPDRYLPSRQLLYKQRSALGEAGLIRLHRWEPAGITSEPNELPDAILRDLDTAIWLVGRKPNRVYAIQQKSDATGRTVQVHLGFASGAMALLDYTNCLPPGDTYHSLSLIAANGAAYADDHQNRQLLYLGGTPQAIQTSEEPGHLAAIAQEFVNALREGRDLSANTNAWKDVFAVAESVKKSLASGRAEVL
jgi:predicted dehydrogenase